MNSSALHAFGTALLQTHKIDIEKKDKAFAERFLQHLDAIEFLFNHIYGGHSKRNQSFDALLISLIKNYQERPSTFIKKDIAKEKKGYWYLSNEITGMSLYVDRFA
ncbi:MAG: Amylosucrase, partial [Bacteroidota bacterium]